ncbi:DUF1566 domain-containing protein [Thermodesulfobacteriota bacterium]
MRACFKKSLLIFFFITVIPINNQIVTAANQKPFYAIQLAAFRTRQRTVNMVTRLTKSGYDAFYRHETVKGKGKWYRVYIDRFGSSQEANERAEELKQKGIFSDYYIRLLSYTHENGRMASDHVPAKTAPPLVIKEIAFKPGENKNEERVYIHANRLFVPLVFTLVGEKPRIVIDIKNTASVQKGQSTIPVNGLYIKRIRTHHDRRSGTLRVVLDHYPSRKYSVNQIFYKAENIYCVIVKSAEETKEEQEAIPSSKANDTAQISYMPSDLVREKLALRYEAKDMKVTDIRVMLLKHNFYASCWNYNVEFCNPEGGFDNRFIDNEDGTVSQHSTGLIWQKGGSAGTLTWEKAGEYVSRLNRQNFAGHDDWRLPTIEELASLVTTSWQKGGLYIDTVFERSQKSCWSADTYGPESAWKSNFYLGCLIDVPKADKNAVRAVRAAGVP